MWLLVVVHTVYHVQCNVRSMRIQLSDMHVQVTNYSISAN